MSNITVSQLTVYPVKSLRGIDVPRIELTSTGPKFDRQWMVVDPTGKFRTQRQLANMCLIDTRLEDEQLVLSRLGHPDVLVPRGGGKPLSANVWRDTVAAQDCGDDVATWLSKVLELPCRMVYMPQGAERPVPGGQHTVGFADAYPILLANEASLADFNQHLSLTIGMDRFRPNITVTGVPAYAEDHWQAITIGELSFNVESPCTRCIMPSIDPATGQKQPEIIDALNQVRRFGTETRFGQNVSYDAFGTLNVGDRVALKL